MSKPSRINIYVDNQNVKLTLDLANLLLVFAKMQAKVKQAKIYDFWPDKTPNSAHKTLENLGFQCLSVSSQIKDCADYQLVFDCISDFDGNGWPDSVILVSGDGDFLPLVNHLKKIAIKAIVFARRGNVKKSLMESADEFHFIDELPQLIEIETEIENESERSESQTILAVSQTVSQSETTDISVNYITYDQAVQSLLEAIHTALSQGKPTHFNYVDTLMRNNPNFPNYQGVASIQKLDGGKFSKFGKFIEAAVADGKVRLKQNKKIQEVTLVENPPAEKTDAVSQFNKQKESASGITYDEAVQSLLEAIHTALSAGKATRFTYIDNLMRHNPNYPTYQGVASIQKPDGSTFSKFGEFIGSVIADGKVRLKQNKKIQEVTLVGKKPAKTTDAASKSKKQKKSLKGVTYDEAIHCLIEAIKTISPQGTCADLSALDRVMRSSQRFYNYKGVRSIQEHKGEKFTKLSKFLEAAEKDKRVMLKKHKKKIKEVILIG